MTDELLQEVRDLLKHGGLSSDAKVLAVWLAVTPADERDGKDLEDETGLTPPDMVQAASDLHYANLWRSGMRFIRPE